jgi:hypothetical protein
MFSILVSNPERSRLTCVVAVKVLLGRMMNEVWYWNESATENSGGLL